VIRLAALVIALAVLSSGAQGASTTGTILFSSTRAPELWGEIYLVRDGHTRNLTHSPADDRDAVLSPDRATVAFVSDRVGARDAVWTMTTTGGRLRRVTPLYAHISGLRWTRAGMQYIVGRDYVRGTLYAADVATGRVMRLKTHVAPIPNAGGPVDCSARTWSRAALPGGGVIVVRSHGGDSDANLWTIRSSGGATPRLLVGDPRQWETQASWSPDGQQVAYLSEDILSNGGDPCAGLQGPVSVVDADGQNAKPLTADDFDDGPAWSPDGTLIGFSRESISLPDPKIALLTVDPATRAVHQLTPNGSGGGEPISGPAWSPDGASLVYGRFVVHRWDVLHTLDTARGKPTRTYGEGQSPAWSPDGRLIASVLPTTGGYATRYALNILDVTTARSRTLTTWADGEQPQWSPDGRHLAVAGEHGVVVTTTRPGSARVVAKRAAQSVAWSPDGKQLVFAGWDGARGRPAPAPDASGCCTTDLYVVNADGTGLRRLTHDRALITSVNWRR